MAGCELHSIIGIPVRCLLFLLCACVLLFKRSREDPGLGRTWVDFLLDASKQLVGFLWVGLLDTWGLAASRDGQPGDAACNWLWVCTVMGATAGVLIEYLLLNMLSFLLGWATGIRVRARKVDMLREEFDLDGSLSAEQVVVAVSAERGVEPFGTLAEQVDRLLDELGLGCEFLEAPAADFSTGDYRDIWGGLVVRKYVKQLVLWLSCIAGMKFVVARLMHEFHSAFADLADLCLMPVSWSDGLQLAAVAVLTPCCAQCLQAWITDEFLRKGGLPVPELLEWLAQRAKAVWESLSRGRRRGNYYDDLQQALLQTGRSREVVVESPCGAGPRQAAVRSRGASALPTGGTAGAEEVHAAAEPRHGTAQAAAHGRGAGVPPAGGAGAGAEEARASAEPRRGPGQADSPSGSEAAPNHGALLQVLASPADEVQEATTLRAQTERLLSLEERLAERDLELQGKLRELDELRRQLTAERAEASPAAPQHPDGGGEGARPSARRQPTSPTSPPLPGAPRPPEESLETGTPQPPPRVEQPTASGTRLQRSPSSSRSSLRAPATAKDEGSAKLAKDTERRRTRPRGTGSSPDGGERRRARAPPQQALTGVDLDRKIATLEAKIAELQRARATEEDINEFQMAGEGVIQEFLGGGRGVGSRWRAGGYFGR